jgi:outer membrane protein TolC
MNVPIFDGRLTEGRKQQARAQRDTARDALYQTTQFVAQETAQSLLDLQTSIEEIRAAEITVASAQEDLRLANGRYDATVGILLEILDAQSALTAAQVELARAKFARSDAYFALERAVGAPLGDIAPTPDEEDTDAQP